ncbi:ABC transporter substrate-binding protein [Photobacterium indicum]|uniref:ABC transporter substrate-binding protein n=1 Tax=Photobacterium indicum TaxID=81447 RepID=UPI003D135D0D
MFKTIFLFFLIFTPLTVFSVENKSIVILTTFSEDSISQLVKHYQLYSPETKVSIIFRRTRSALRLLERNDSTDIDIIISSSSVLFHNLEEKDKLQLLKVNNKTPEWLTPHILDMSGKIAAFAYSGFGFMYNTQYLASHQLSVPKTWQDLSDSQYFQHITMSTPARSGTTSLIVENILQNYGWEEGWRLLMNIGGNIAFISSRSFGVSEAISQGLIGAGPVIDSYAIDNKKRFDYINFNYIPDSIIMPTYIALAKGSTSPQESKKFIDFLLAKEGQQLLETTAMAKFSLTQPDRAQNTVLILNRDLVYSRDRLISLLFDQAITEQLHELNATWESIYQLENNSNLAPNNKALLMQAKQYASRVPITVTQASTKEYLALFSLLSTERDLTPEVAEEIQRWKMELKSNLQQANQLINQISQE